MALISRRKCADDRAAAALELTRLARAVLSAHDDTVVSIGEHDCDDPECSGTRTVVLILRARHPTKAIQIEKLIKDNDDKLPTDVKESVQADVDALKTALAGDDDDAVKAAYDTLNQSQQKLGEAIYQAAQAEGAQGDPNVFKFERAPIKMEFTRMLDMLTLGGYGYLERLEVQASPRFEIDEKEVEALRGHFKEVVVERILELPRMWLPPVCVGQDDGPGGSDSWTTTHY